jgi:hypothetical protein
MAMESTTSARCHAGDSPKKARRMLKLRIANAVFRRLELDQRTQNPPTSCAMRSAFVGSQSAWRNLIVDGGQVADAPPT